jgi:phage baseplate assembly protein W
MANDLKTFDTQVKGKSKVIFDFKDNISSTGDFAKVEGINVLLNSLKNLLGTPLGTYPFNPHYGSELYKQIFEPLDAETMEDIDFEVRDRVIEFDDRIQILNVITTPLSDRKGLSVSVRIKKGDEIGNISVDIDESLTFGLE